MTSILPNRLVLGRRACPATAWIRQHAIIGLAVGAGIGLIAVDVGANGRLPSANQLVVQPMRPDTLAVRTTFGTLVSVNGGHDFDWICEAVVGYGGNADPGLALFGDGTLAFATSAGLSISHDGGCSFAFQGGALAGEYVIDDAVDATRPSHGVAVTSTLLMGGTSSYHTQVFATDDAGKTWSALGAALPEDIIAETVELAQRHPERLYVSGGYGASGDAPAMRHGVVAASNDAGATWTRVDVALPMYARAAFVAAVDPNRPDRVYLRTGGGGVSGTNTLLVSDDGAKTFREVFSVKDEMSGFALSPDGGRVAVGGPSAGLWIADAATLSFTAVGDRPVRCLAWGDRGLYACGDEATSGFVVGVSTDEGKSFLSLLATLSDSRGPLASCSADSRLATNCGPLWPAVAGSLGVPASRATSGAGTGGMKDGAAGGTGASVPTSGSGGSGGGCVVARGRANSIVTWAVSLAVAVSIAQIRHRRRCRRAAAFGSP